MCLEARQAGGLEVALGKYHKYFICSFIPSTNTQWASSE